MAVDVAELYADGLTDINELEAACRNADEAIFGKASRRNGREDSDTSPASGTLSWHPNLAERISQTQLVMRGEVARTLASRRLRRYHPPKRNPVNRKLLTKEEVKEPEAWGSSVRPGS